MIEVIYEDNHLLVLNKPAGILTQPSGTDQLNLEQEAKVWLKNKYVKPGNVFLEAVHRIDKPVSGIVLFTKTSKALSRLNASIRSKDVCKFYWAWVEGNLAQEAILEHYLIHDEHRAQVVTQKHPQAKLARLNYRILKKSEQFNLLEIQLETGRYHQIRAQFAEMRCPLLGDSRYGSRYPLAPGVIALHHKRLVIPHPISQEPLTFEASLPAYFELGQA